MDFRQTIQSNNSRPNSASPAPAAPERKESRGSGKFSAGNTKWIRLLSMVLLAGVVVLLLVIAFAFARGGDNEGKFIKSNNYQAVFLNNGQVYFGNIQDLNGSYVRMTNIYYLTQNGSGSSSTSSNNYSLVKLGCQQIHDPLDEMVINRDQVTFWENLNPSGKVVSSIKQFQQQNPNGPNCSQVSNQTQASGDSSTTQGAASATQGSTAPTTSTGTSTKK